ncbi:MAG: GNAT family N-acetyltransferase [Prevotellaceae bacterium]|jgi:putative acetyltransferase|nr:GNAT family N-acetyltransferase [Prevotellaceae bacterium]
MQELGIIIRQIEEKDNSDLAKIIRNTFVEYCAPREGTVYSDSRTDDLFTLFRKSGSILWVAVIDGHVEGCCGIFPTEGLDNDCAELVKFYLNPGFRGRGIGKKLISKSIQFAKQWGYKHLYLESCAQFVQAVGMYEKIGFERLEHPLGNSCHNLCNIWMIKEL